MRGGKSKWKFRKIIHGLILRFVNWVTNYILILIYTLRLNSPAADFNFLTRLNLNVCRIWSCIKSNLDMKNLLTEIFRYECYDTATFSSSRFISIFTKRVQFFPVSIINNELIRV